MISLRVRLLGSLLAVSVANASADGTTWRRSADLVTPADAKRWAALQPVANAPRAKRDHWNIDQARLSEPLPVETVLNLLERSGDPQAALPSFAQTLSAEIALGVRRFREWRVDFYGGNDEARAMRENPQATTLCQSTPTLDDWAASGVRVEAIGFAVKRTAAPPTITWYDTAFSPRTAPEGWTPRQWETELNAGPFSKCVLLLSLDPEISRGSKTLQIFDARSKALLGEASWPNQIPDKGPLTLIAALATLHATPLTLRFADAIEGPPGQALSATEGALYDDGEGHVVILLARGTPPALAEVHAATTWSLLLEEDPLNDATETVDYLFETVPRFQKDAFAFEVGSSAAGESLTPLADVIDPDGRRRLTFTKDQARRINRFRVTQPQKARALLTTVPMPTNLFPPLPASGDLFDLTVPYLSLRHARDIEAVVSRLARIRLEGRDLHWTPGQAEAAFPLEFTNVALRDLWSDYLDSRYPGKEPRYDPSLGTVILGGLFR